MTVRELFDLSGRVAIVTGGATGIGLQMADTLAELGASVVVCGRDGERCERVAGDLERERGVRCAGLPCDVSSSDAVTRLVAKTTDRFGRIDVLVNNAGTAWADPVEDTPLRGWQKVVDVNLTGVFLCSQAAGRVMIGQGGGKIVNIASITGLRGQPPEELDAIAYSTTKGAVVAFTRDLATKWARHGIAVNAIAPGWFPTDLSQPVLARAGDRLTAAIPMRRYGGDSDLKGAIAYLASAASDYVTGHTLVVDGGATI
ncbi:MAG TPA: glucose 1-dehydrogenase [Gaiellales bacterium]|nr:glucose 1-dehydrogenase [Gaiellales bacterium]